MEELKFYFRTIYRLSRNHQKQEEIVWNNLKKMPDKMGGRCGVYEKDRYIETNLAFDDKTGCTFYYMIYDMAFHCRVRVLENFPTELTTDLFILAEHFNNILSDGVVKINVDDRCIEYHQKLNLLIPLLYDSAIYGQISRHYNVAKDIYSAFLRLVEEQEAPAIIIADLIRSIEEKDNNRE